jgi:putative heme-binding domain-containing protein
LQGDPRRGSVLLNDTARISCLQCHQFAGAGRAFGPDFKKTAKTKTKVQILDSILEPSKEIAPEYVLHTVDLANDEQLSGIVLSRSKEEILLRDATATDHQIPAGRLRSIRPQQLSAMPEGLLAGLGAQEISDLLEALVEEGRRK